jgi:hypothetical protein
VERASRANRGCEAVAATANYAAGLSQPGKVGFESFHGWLDERRIRIPSLDQKLSAARCPRFQEPGQQAPVSAEWIHHVNNGTGGISQFVRESLGEPPPHDFRGEELSLCSTYLDRQVQRVLLLNRTQLINVFHGWAFPGF